MTLHSVCSYPLNRPGASEFSATLATVIASRLDTPRSIGRWVELPVFQGRPAATPLEDIVESRIATARLDAKWQ
jgi:hypothetical protein